MRRRRKTTTVLAAMFDAHGAVEIKQLPFPSMATRGKGKGSAKRKNTDSGGLYTHVAGFATTYEPSADGRRVIGRSAALEAESLDELDEASYSGEDFKTAEALESEDFSYLCGEGARWDDDDWTGRVPLDGEEELEGKVDDGITVRLGTSTGEDGAPLHFERWEAAVRPVNFEATKSKIICFIQDKPMKVFVEKHRNEALDEMLRGEGRGSPIFWANCADCGSDNPMFRCARQTCLGPGMYCEQCIISMHRGLPTHMLEVKWLSLRGRPTLLMFCL